VSARGQRPVESVPFQPGKNFSVLRAFFRRACSLVWSREQFLFWPVPEAIMGARLPGSSRQVVEAAGCSLLHSPDFNPIELARGWIKQFVGRLAPRDPAARLAAIQSAIASLPAEFARSWFRKTGLQF
jgi:hypothetical protein